MRWIPLLLDKESFLANQKQWYGCSAEEATAKWKSALASPHVHREKVDGVMQVAVKKTHRDSPRAHHRHGGKGQREDEERGQDHRETTVLRSL